MIQEFINAMTTPLLAKFILNDIPHALLGAESAAESKLVYPPAPWFGVWYEKPEVRSMVESAPGLLNYIAAIMVKLQRKCNTAPKNIGFAELPDALASYIWGDVIFSTIFANIWLMDEEKTKQLIGYIVPHEFGHYMMAVEHVRIPLPKGLKWKEARKKWADDYADRFAEQESGITKEQTGRLVQELGIEWEQWEQWERIHSRPTEREV